MTEASRTDRYLKRLRDYCEWELSTDAERRAFIETQIEIWDERYSRFIATEGQSEPKATAFDFVSTIAALGAELAKHKQVEAA